MSESSKPQDLSVFDFTMSVRYLFNSIEKLMCGLPPLNFPYGILWYLGLPLQLLLIILGKIIRFPAEIWESSKDEKIVCKNYNKLGFIGYILTFVIDIILYIHGGILKTIDIVITSLGLGYAGLKAEDLLIPQVEDFDLKVL